MSQILPVASLLVRPTGSPAPQSLEMPHPGPAADDGSPRRVLVPAKAVQPQSLRSALALFPRERFHFCALCLVDLRELTGGLPDMSAGNFGQVRARAFAAEEEFLAEFSRPLTEMGHTVEPVLRCGPMIAVMPRAALEMRVDLAILDRCKAGFLRKSVAQAVMERARCPVLLLDS